MMRSALVLAMLAVGCGDESSEPPACEPMFALDSVYAAKTETVDVGYPDTSFSSYCVRLDTTAMSRPHFEIAHDSSYLLELRDLGNTAFATSGDVTIGDLDYTAVQWDPAGGDIYDILLHVEPKPGFLGGGRTTVTMQLSVRP